MKFLCDEMLAGVGRWLRAAGYDTKIITESCSDQKIFDCSKGENRLLLTRDRHFLEKKHQDLIIFLKSNSLKQCIEEFNALLEIDWEYRPFSRCLLCNTPFITPENRTVQELVPEEVQERTDDFFYCPHCHKVYWEGSHTRNMLAQLKAWNNH